jgi:hypothetical protein
MFDTTVDTLLDWMESTSVDIDLVDCMEEYLKHHGEVDVQKLALLPPQLHAWVIEHNILGWDNLMDGRIGQGILLIQHASLKQSGSQLHIRTWVISYVR